MDPMFPLRPVLSNSVWILRLLVFLETTSLHIISGLSYPLFFVISVIIVSRLWVGAYGGLPKCAFGST